jgi:hypothetical protein
MTTTENMNRKPLDFATAKVGDIVYRGKGATRWVIVALYPAGLINAHGWASRYDAVVTVKEGSQYRGGNTLQAASQFTTEGA